MREGQARIVRVPGEGVKACVHAKGVWIDQAGGQGGYGRWELGFGVRASCGDLQCPLVELNVVEEEMFLCAFDGSVRE